jgi:broad specificity phosphatase PhoE
LGKILIVNTGPTGQERYSSYPVDDKAELDAPPAEWAQAAAERLSEYGVKAVYACPVPGAEEMAEIIATRFNLKTDILPELSVPQPSRWIGMDPEDAMLLDCSFAEAPAEVKVKLPFENSIDELRTMAAAAIESIAVKHKKEAAVIVSHRSLTVIMIMHMLHMHNRHYRQVAQDYGAVNLFEVRFGMTSALYINDTCHLQGLMPSLRGARR